jgi:hypothetical protein
MAIEDGDCHALAVGKRAGSVRGASYVGHVAWSHEEVLLALDECAYTLSELAWALGVSEREADDRLRECIRRGWVVRPQPVATAPMPEGWAAYLMLSAKGEAELEEVGAADP